MQAHLLVFDPLQIDKDRFRNAIDGLASVENWTLFFGNTMCLASTSSAQTLAKEIKAALPRARFLISTIDPEEKAGWLPKQLWEFMNEPEPFRESSDA